MRASWGLVGLVGVVGLVAACGESQAPPPGVKSCADGWQGVSTLVAEIPPEQLALQDGLIYYASRPVGGGDPTINVIPTTGGPPTALVPDWGSGVWLQGDRLFYAQGPRVYAAPRAGGAGTLIGEQARGPEGILPNSFGQAVDGSWFYWLQQEPGLTTNELWRLPLAGGAPQRLGEFTFELSSFGDRLYPLGDVVIAVSLGGEAVSVPTAGGDPRPFDPAAGEFLNTDGDAIMWLRFTGQAGYVTSYETRLTDTAGGSPRPFWRDKPPALRPYLALGDGAGGWYVEGREMFDDGQAHSSVWHLDAAGAGARVACTSYPDENASAAVVGADGMYLASATLGDYTHWNLVRIAR